MNFSKVKGMIILSFLFMLGICSRPLQCHAMEEESLPQEALYAGAAVLMDGVSGRILYEKKTLGDWGAPSSMCPRYGCFTYVGGDRIGGSCLFCLRYVRFLFQEVLSQGR